MTDLTDRDIVTVLLGLVHHDSYEATRAAIEALVCEQATNTGEVMSAGGLHEDHDAYHRLRGDLWSRLLHMDGDIPSSDTYLVDVARKALMSANERAAYHEHRPDAVVGHWMVISPESRRIVREVVPDLAHALNVLAGDERGAQGSAEGVSA